jgi:GNAT superfamily N-acetyltransferase
VETQETKAKQEGYTLRQMVLADGPAIRKLNEQSPDTGAVRFVAEYHYDAYEVLTALHPGMTGVVAEAPGYDGIVGMGLMTLGECQFEGEMRPSAYLSTLGVHPDYRRRGIASKLARWRFESAQRHFDSLGREGVVFAAIQDGNTGSLQTAVKWSTQRLEGHGDAAVARMRSQPSKPLDGVEVRPARPDEFDEIAEKQNGFYRDFNFYSPESAEDLSEWRAELVFGYPLHDYLVAVDRDGNLLAGFAVSEYGRLITDHLVYLPPPLRLANVFLRIVPRGGVSKRMRIERVWFEGNKVAICRHLWESARWLLRDRGTMLMTFFDPHGPLNDAIPRPRFVPRTGGSLVLRAPVPAGGDRPVYLQP